MDPKDRDEELENSNNDYDDGYEEHKRKESEMDSKYPGYSNESKRAGLFLGLDHPYVPGDF